MIRKTCLILSCFVALSLHAYETPVHELITLHAFERLRIDFQTRLGVARTHTINDATLRELTQAGAVAADNAPYPVNHFLDPELPADPAGATIDYVTLPPNKMPGSARGAYARAAEASSRWRDSTLPIDRIGSAPCLAASLAAANPFALDLHRTLSPLPLYWAEWHRSSEQLPPELGEDVPFPPHTIVDYAIRSRTTPLDRDRRPIPALSGPTGKAAGKGSGLGPFLTARAGVFRGT